MRPGDILILLTIPEWESLSLIHRKGKGIGALMQDGCITGR
jgi:hypothetical protein